MRTGTIVGLCLAAVAGACGDDLQLNLVINDPCNQAVFGNDALGLEHIQVEIFSPQLPEAQGATWRRAEGDGEMADLTPVAEALLTVTGRASNSSGQAGGVLAATTVGRLDLTGIESAGVVDISVVLGRVGMFMNTTDTDAATNGAIKCTTMVLERTGHTASLLPDGRVLIAGGARETPISSAYWETTEFFDPVTGLFEGGPKMRWVRKGHTATVLDDGRILIAGGLGLIDGDPSTLSVAQIYDPATESFNVGNGSLYVRMTEQRAYHTATLLGDGRVLLAGGQVGNWESQTTEIFDPATSSFCAGPSLESQPRAHHAAVRVGRNTVALIGGQGSGLPVGLVQFVLVGRCEQGSVINGPTLMTARSYPMAAIYKDNEAIVVAGGFAAAVASPDAGTGINKVEVIQVSSSNLAHSTIVCDSAHMVVGRGAGTMVALGDGYLVAGGVGSPKQVQNSAEWLTINNLLTCNISSEYTEGRLGIPQAGSAATTLLGGDVLLTGGFGSNATGLFSLDHAEIYVRQR